MRARAVCSTSTRRTSGSPEAGPAPTPTLGAASGRQGDWVQQLLSSPVLLFELVVALAAGGGLFALFVRWERTGRPELAVAILGGAVLAQNLLYKSDVRVPVGPLRPGPQRIFEI